MLKAPRVTRKNVQLWTKTFVGSGVDAKYNHVNDHWGFKWFSSLNSCINNMAYQYTAFKNGWGPDVGKYPIKFNWVVNGGTFTRWGFLTERVETFADYRKRMNISYDEAHINGNPNYALYFGVNFPQAAKKLDWQIADEHGGNLGFSKVDGRSLWIDFGYFNRTSPRSISKHQQLMVRYEKRVKNYCAA